MVVLRKPAEEMQRDRFHFVPFFPRPPYVEQEREEHSAPALSKAPEPRVRASILRHNARLALRTRGGDRIAARRDLVEALRLEPFHLKAYLRLIGTFLPQRMVRALSVSARGEK